MKTTIYSLATAAALTAMLAAAPRGQAEPLPKPVADLECLAGNWRGGGTVAMGADTAKVQGTWSCKRTAAKFGMLCEFRLTGLPGVKLYVEQDLFGWEPNTNTYHWFSVTNAGETHDHVGQVPAAGDNKAHFVFTGTQEGKPFREVIDFEFGKDEQSVSVKAETFVADKSTSLFSLAMRK